LVYKLLDIYIIGRIRGGYRALQCKTQNAKRKTQNAKRKTQNAKRLFWLASSFGAGDRLGYLSWG